MSLKSKIEQLKGKSSADPITPEFHGSILDDIQKVTETVDTIADLRQFDTTQLSHGQIIRVNAHNADGLDRRFGAGYFIWKTTPLFSVNQVGGIPAANTDLVTVTPTTRGFALPALGGYTSQLPKLVYGNGVEGVITITNSLAGSRETTLGKGETSLDLRVDADVPDGTGAFRRDDDGVYIRPSYVGFDGAGYWERVLYDNFVTPEMYGAIPNDSFKDGAVNECSGAIQKAFDSSWNVRMKGGAYYINSPIVAERGKVIEMSQYYHIESNLGVNRRTRPTDASISSLYITTNIDMVIIRTTDLKWNYGLLDSRGAPSTSDKAAFRYDMSASVAFSNLNKPHIVGTKDQQLSAVDGGITAVLIDIENATSNNSVPNTFGIGSLFFTYIDFSAERINTAYWVNGQPLEEGYNYYTNSVRVNMISQRNKRAVYMESSQGSSYFTGFHQASPTLLEAQKDWPVCTYIGGDIYHDIFSFDLSNGPDGEGIYTNNHANDFRKANVFFGPYGLKNPTDRNYMASGSLGSFQFNPGKVAPSKGAPLISRLTNGLALPVQRGATYTINAYNATGVDLTTTLGSSSGLPTAGNVAITNPDRIWDLNILRGTNVQFNSGADLENDFVEIELTNLNQALWTDVLYVLVDWGGAICNQIQVITGQEGDLGQQTIDINTEFSPLTRGQKLYGFNGGTLQWGFAEDTLRVRFIGMNELGSYEIMDIITGSRSAPYFPYIHTQGGQKIYGSLEVDELDFTIEGSLSTGRLNNKKNTKIYEREITAAEIGSLFSTPIELLYPSEFGKGVRVVSAVLREEGGSTNWTGTIGLRATGTALSSFTWGTVNLAQVTDTYNRGVGFNINPSGTQAFRTFGTRLELFAETENPSGGDTDFILTIEIDLI